MTSAGCRLFIVLTGAPNPVQPNPHSACSASVFAARFALHGSVGLLHALTYARVQPHVQMTYPERPMPSAWRALAGRQSAQCATPPGHRIPVPSGRGKMQGKIKGRGTARRRKRVCTWGWRGTPILTAPCRWLHQSRVGLEEAACLLRRRAMGLEGVHP